MPKPKTGDSKSGGLNFYYLSGIVLNRIKFLIDNNFMKEKKTSKKANYEEISKIIKENYIYFLVGIIMFFIGVGIAAFVLNAKIGKGKKIVISKTKNVKVSGEEKKGEKKNIRVHVVKRGEYLWKIAEEVYGSGYNAIDIAKANHLKNPNLLYRGQKLVLPDVKARKITRKMSSTGMKTQIKKTSYHKSVRYRVQKGDYLWKIALKTYGDGFAWVKIAKANHLKNPNLIYRNQILILP